MQCIHLHCAMWRNMLSCLISLPISIIMQTPPPHLTPPRIIHCLARRCIRHLPYSIVQKLSLKSGHIPYASPYSVVKTCLVKVDTSKQQHINEDFFLKHSHSFTRQNETIPLQTIMNNIFFKEFSPCFFWISY
jgi:hypothetical protein